MKHNETLACAKLQTFAKLTDKIFGDGSFLNNSSVVLF